MCCWIADAMAYYKSGYLLSVMSMFTYIHTLSVNAFLQGRGGLLNTIMYSRVRPVAKGRGAKPVFLLIFP